MLGGRLVDWSFGQTLRSNQSQTPVVFVIEFTQRSLIMELYEKPNLNYLPFTIKLSVYCNLNLFTIK